MKDDNPELVIDRIIDKVGKNLVVGTPLAAGKPNHLLNALYKRVRNNPDLNLKIFTALTLDKPKGESLLEKRFLEPMAERVFGDYPDLDYEQDRHAGTLPPNVDILEFYFPAGRFLQNDYAQQNYICSNYTHVARDMMDAGVNVLLQMVHPRSHPPDAKAILKRRHSLRTRGPGQPEPAVYVRRRTGKPRQLRLCAGKRGSRVQNFRPAENGGRRP
jgi:acyl-CoA hydrolase